MIRRILSGHTAVKPDEKTYTALCRIISSYIDQARKNERAFISRGEAVYLHNYRVPLRKIRSILEIFSRVFCKEESRLIRKQLALVMNRTNALRDMDVLLDAIENSLITVSSEKQRGLRLLYELIEQERSLEYKDVMTFLNLDEYKAMMKSLRKAFGRMPGIGKGPDAQKHIGKCAGMRFLEVYERIIRSADETGPGSNEQDYHLLRIECKKLRYIITPFISLFPAEKAGELILPVKTLQEILGEYNDYRMQINRLADFVREMQPVSRDNPACIDSAEFLMKLLSEKKADCLVRLENEIKVFTGCGKQEQFRKNFAAE